MATDALMSITALGVRTTAGSTAGLTLPHATMLRPFYARVIYSAASTSSGTGSAVLGVDVSYDGGSTFSVLSETAPIALSTTAASGEVTIPVLITRADLVQSSNAAANAPQVRFALE